MVTSEKIVMKDELEVYIKIQKNLPNYSIMESAAPFTRDFQPLDNARAEHTKRKSPVNLAIYRTLRREVPELSRYNSLIFSCLQISTFLRVASVKLNYEYFVIMQ